jgi:hypothetical protein
MPKRRPACWTVAARRVSSRPTSARSAARPLLPWLDSDARAKSTWFNTATRSATTSRPWPTATSADPIAGSASSAHGPGLTRAERIADFPVAAEFRHAADAPRVVLVMHNIGYLEPALDYGALTQRIRAMCRRFGRVLEVLPHPASGETFGLPAVTRCGAVDAALFIGYRSTLLDQLPRGVPRVSLLDYWPAFFMHEGQAHEVEDFFTRIEQALS